MKCRMSATIVRVLVYVPNAMVLVSVQWIVAAKTLTVMDALGAEIVKRVITLANVNGAVVADTRSRIVNTLIRLALLGLLKK